MASMSINHSLVVGETSVLCCVAIIMHLFAHRVGLLGSMGIVMPAVTSDADQVSKSKLAAGPPHHEQADRDACRKGGSPRKNGAGGSFQAK